MVDPVEAFGDWAEDDFCTYDEVLTGTGGYRGPGSAGADWCACGFSTSWPDGLGDDERHYAQQLMVDHEQVCPAWATPATVAVLHARHKANVNALANDTVRSARRMLTNLRAAGLPPAPTSALVGAYLELAGEHHPDLAGWRP